MTECERNFDEALLSGYMDGALTQAEEQKVRLHLEECEECGRLLDEIRQMREVTMSTEFRVPVDDGWDERPRGLLSGLFRGSGFVLLIVWLAGLSGFALWELVTEPEDLLPKLMALGLVSGIALVFLSVLIDRMRRLKTDRYRRVER